MDNYTFNEKPPQDYEQELKSLNSKILTMSGYIIAMRSGTMQDFQQIKNDLKNIIQYFINKVNRFELDIR